MIINIAVQLIRFFARTGRRTNRGGTRGPSGPKKQADANKNYSTNTYFHGSVFITEKNELLNMLQKKLVPSQRQGYKEYRLKIKLIPSAMAAQDNDNDANKKLFVQFN